jgi:tRNA pseudouridine55 synthase
MNRLFVGYKPSGISSNQFLSRIKRRYKTKKAGYSGTLDPFAKGVLIIALGNHTRLFRFLDKTPKTYRATLWLGAHSQTLDIEAVYHIDELHPLHVNDIHNVLASLQGDITYDPPQFSAKKINGKRAYALAREGKEAALEPITSQIHAITLLHYCHPFITFEATVSEGTYIRSLGAIIAQRLGTTGGILSALERLQEGKFRYNNEQPIDIKTILNMPQNRYFGDPQNLEFGRKLALEDLESQSEGTYWIDSGVVIAIICIENGAVSYLLNKVESC